jgi:hypothetical protein
MSFPVNPVAATSGPAPYTPGSALSSAVAGMQRAEAALARDAATIAANGPDVASTIDLVVQPQAYAADGQVVRAQADTTCALLDVLA